MSVRPSLTAAPSLVGTNGILLNVRIAVPWRELEDVLEALSGADFPINPEIRHGSPMTFVDFPAYSNQIGEIRRLVGVADARIETQEVWAGLTGA